MWLGRFLDSSILLLAFSTRFALTLSLSFRGIAKKKRYKFALLGGRLLEHMRYLSNEPSLSLWLGLQKYKLKRKKSKFNQKGFLGTKGKQNQKGKGISW